MGPTGTPETYVASPKATEFDAIEAEVIKGKPDRTGQFNQPIPLSPYSVHIRFSNGLSKAVSVVERTGIMATIPPDREAPRGQFTVFVRVSWSRNIGLDVNSLRSSHTDLDELWLEAIENGRQSNEGGNQRSAEMAFSIKSNHIFEQGGSIYVRSLDRVFSIADPAYVPFHPYSAKGVSNQFVENEMGVNKTDSFGYSIRIVDKQQRFGDRFININHQVYRVRAVQDSDLEDGIYVTTTGRASANPLPPPEHVHYSFKEGEAALNLYKTIADAQTFGDPKRAHDEQINERLREIQERETQAKKDKAQAEQDLMKLKLEYERESAQRKQEYEDLKHQHEVDMLERKDRYEQRSFWRKAWNEIIRLIPSIITGLVTVWFVIKRLRPSPA